MFVYRPCYMVTFNLLKNSNNIDDQILYKISQRRGNVHGRKWSTNIMDSSFKTSSRNKPTEGITCSEIKLPKCLFVTSENGVWNLFAASSVGSVGLKTHTRMGSCYLKFGLRNKVLASLWRLLEIQNHKLWAVFSEPKSARQQDDVYAH